MCGIAGIIDFSGISEFDKSQIQASTTSLKHRGPDAEGFVFGDFFTLGHRRLSIVDLSNTANQPMYSSCGNYVVVFNGEIYNHSEIRKDLQKKHKFTSDHSDTEVILNSFKEWGIKCVDRFVGMFAICIVDIVNQECYLIRDRIGQKPLYYIANNGKVSFASEAHSLQYNYTNKEINHNAIHTYLTFLSVPAPQSFYQNINKLEAGTILKIIPRGLDKTKYWDISNFLNNTIKIDEKDAIIETERLLEKSMYYRNLADAKTSIALSGGLDSSLNLYYSKNLGFNPSAINLSFGNTSNQFNENHSAQKFCKKMGVNLTVNNITKEDLGEMIENYLQSQIDMPCGDPNGVLLSIMSETVKSSGAKVLIVGEGGDEIGGYSKYIKHYKRYQRYKNYSSLLSFLIRKSPFYLSKTLDTFYNNKMVSASHIHGFTENEQQRLLISNANYSAFEALTSFNTDILANTDEWYYKQVSNLEYKLRLPEMILARIDYPTMQHGVEARSPFVDHKLVEFSAQLPFRLKMRGNNPKYLLKKIAENKLPTYITNAPKVGFGQLLTPYLYEELPLLFNKEIIINTDAPIKQFISKENLTYFANLQKKHKQLSYRLWILYALNRWLTINN